MKLTLLFITILVASAFCETTSEAKINHDGHEHHHNRVEKISDFFTGFFSHFNLPKPTQIINCFCEDNAKLYLRSLFETKKLLQDANDRKTVRFHFELVKWGLIEHELRGTHACIAMTEDFTDLLNTLGVKKRNPKHFHETFYLYYQAHYQKLLEDFAPIVERLKAKDAQAAGVAFGNMISNMVETVSKEGFLHLAYAGFSNGQAIELGIENPEDSLKCFDNDSAGLYLEFTYKLADAVASGKWQESALNANNFWEKEGEAILEKIPESVWGCWLESEDAKRVNAKLGVNVTDMAFIQMMLKYNNDRRFAYYTYMKSLKSAFDDFNFNHAGTIDAHYNKAIVEFDNRESM